MTLFKKLIRRIHLLLGLSSGLLVLFLGLTGCILAFETEIRQLTQPYLNVHKEEKPFQLPSVLRDSAEKYLPAKINGIEYPGAGKAALAYYYNATEYRIAALNPYNGRVLKVKNMNRDFFRVILAGHYNLWLPEATGQFIVATGTLVFVVMMITGIILWWPRYKGARKQRFTMKFNVRWRRRNYDLHTVLGFYMSWISIFIALTGLVMGFSWFAKGVYWTASGGRSMVVDKHPVSDTLQAKNTFNMSDHLWLKHRSFVGEDESLGVYFANLPTDPVEIVVNHRPGTYYNSDYYHYDQFTGKRVAAQGSYEGRFREAAFADQIMRMNYDIHVGAILGLPGKLLVFLASLIAASLPITGFLIWRGRRNKGRTAVL